uniref:Uncharacterized protein n=1 Tax=Mesocestoides corti TaxID=53468 RepID=A0A5K3F338_MESCO
MTEARANAGKHRVPAHAAKKRANVCKASCKSRKARSCPVHGRRTRKHNRSRRPGMKATQSRHASQSKSATPCSPSSSSCILARIVNYIVARTVGRVFRGSNSSNSSLLNLNSLNGRVDSILSLQLSPRVRGETKALVQHLRCLARLEAMERYIAKKRREVKNLKVQINGLNRIRTTRNTAALHPVPFSKGSVRS